MKNPKFSQGAGVSLWRSPNMQLCHQVMVEVQHLQFAALTQPLGDTFQHVPLIRQRQFFVSAKQTHSVQESEVFMRRSYQDKSTTIRFSGTGSISSCFSSANSMQNSLISECVSIRYIYIYAKHNKSWYHCEQHAGL